MPASASGCRRIPEGATARPAIRPALALSAAWLLFWPYQNPWYDVMIVCLLVFYPASRLDWLVLGRLAAATVPTIPGNPPTIMVAGTSHVVILFHNLAGETELANMHPRRQPSKITSGCKYSAIGML